MFICAAFALVEETSYCIRLMQIYRTVQMLRARDRVVSGGCCGSVASGSGNSAAEGVGRISQPEDGAGV